MKNEIKWLDIKNNRIPRINETVLIFHKNKIAIATYTEIFSIDGMPIIWFRLANGSVASPTHWARINRP